MEAALEHADWSSLDLTQWEDVPFELPAHTVTITHEPSKTKGSHELRCETCGSIGTADDEQLASFLARLHEALIATIADVSR